MHSNSDSRSLRCVLQGVVICATAIDTPEDYAAIEGQAKRLGAKFSNELASEVSFLVCTRAGSKKHRSVCERNARVGLAQRVLVVKPSWLEACENAALRVSAQTHLLPPLAGMELCCSGLQMDEKSQIEKLALELGARYTKVLGSRCSHLICCTPRGRKFEYARNAPHIAVVRPKWVHECARLNLLVDETPFRLMTSTSPAVTDEGSRGQSSVVNPSLVDSASHAPTSAPPAHAMDSSPMSVVSPPCLDALRIYLTECTFRDEDKYAPLHAKALRLLAHAAATAVPDPRLANFIVVPRPPVPESATRSIKKAVEAGIPVLSVRWLEDCVAQNALLPTENYPVNWELNWKSGGLQGAGTSRDSLPSQSGSLQIPPTSSTFHGCRVSLGALWLRDEAACAHVERQLRSGRAKVYDHDASGAVTVGVPTHIVCASDLQAREHLLLDTAARDNPRVAAVTPFWIDSCEATGKLLCVDLCVLFTPLKHAVPLREIIEQRVSITLSGFQHRGGGGEGEGQWNRRREVLSRLADLLGAKYSEKMRRRGTTHVVADARAAGSDKVRKAREWGIHVVSVDWLLACARTGKVVAPEAFPVAEKMERDVDEDANDGTKPLTAAAAEAAAALTPRKLKELTQTTPRSTPRRSGGARAGEGGTQQGNGDVKDGFAETDAINLFKRLTAGLDKHATDDLDDSLGNMPEDGDAGDDRFRGRRSRSASREAIVITDKEWSMDASQSQVIVHRDLTPPPTPKSRTRSLLTRAAKRPRPS